MNCDDDMRRQITQLWIIKKVKIPSSVESTVPVITGRLVAKKSMRVANISGFSNFHSTSSSV